MLTTTPALFKDEERAVYDQIEGNVRLARYGTDCYGYAMVAAGQADVVIESGLKPYDIVALIPIIEGAGGVVTSWTGGSAANGGPRHRLWRPAPPREAADAAVANRVTHAA